MSRVPFTAYDFFAYLAAGCLPVAAADYFSGTGLLLQPELPIVAQVFLVLVAYLCGHVIAHFSSVVLENGLVFRVLGRPSEVLLAERRSGILPFFFRLYFRPLQEETQQRIAERAHERGFSGQGEALFAHALSLLSKDGALQGRLDEFRNLYGFARNMAFVFLAAAPLLAVATWWTGVPTSYLWVGGALLVGLAFLYRYLKFFRQYSYWLFLRYSEHRD